MYYLCDLSGCYSEDNTEMLEHQENSQEPLCQVSRRQASFFRDIIIDEDEEIKHTTIQLQIAIISPPLSGKITFLSWSL